MPEEYYVPFWVLLNYLDTTPPDPFIKVKLLKVTKTQTISADNDNVNFDYIPTCSIEVMPKVVANDIPRDYLIHKNDLSEWKQRLSQWFLEYEG